jgi:Fe2+ transport system protein FeoA
MMVCPGCGHEFSEEQGYAACGGCLARKSCGLVRCPNCSYESTREPGVLQRVRDWFASRNVQRVATDGKVMAARCPATPSLADLRIGETAAIEKFLDASQMRKFLALGILPGERVTIVKHHPAIVLRVGYSEFAFDRALASTVRVHRLAG